MLVSRHHGRSDLHLGVVPRGGSGIGLAVRAAAVPDGSLRGRQPARVPLPGPRADRSRQSIVVDESLLRFHRALRLPPRAGGERERVCPLPGQRVGRVACGRQPAGAALRPERVPGPAHRAQLDQQPHGRRHGSLGAVRRRRRPAGAAPRRARGARPDPGRLAAGQPGRPRAAPRAAAVARAAAAAARGARGGGVRPLHGPSGGFCGPLFQIPEDRARCSAQLSGYQPGSSFLRSAP